MTATYYTTYGSDIFVALVLLVGLLAGLRITR